jgi:ubiquinone/menaquinone biosynthesis C-methylase UbiE
MVIHGQEESTRDQGMRKRNDVVNSFFDELADQYDAWFDKEGKFIFNIEVWALKEVLPSLPDPWLEVGVGSGRFACALGIQIGIDPSIKLLNIAKSRGITVIQGRGEEGLFKEGVFGTAFLIVTLCFVDSPKVVLKEAYRILKPDGKGVLGLVLKESPWGRLYQQWKTQSHRFYRHAVFYEYNEVIKLLAQSSFTNERVVSTLFQKPGNVRHMEEPQEGYSPGAGFTIIVAGKQSSIKPAPS